MLWSRKRKEMRNALTTNEYPCKGEVHLMDYAGRVRSKDRPSPCAITFTSEALWRPALPQDRMVAGSSGAGLTSDVARAFNLRQFDADFLKKRRSAREPSAERFDKTIVALGALGTGCRARLLWECRR